MAIETIKFEDVEKNLPSGVPANIRALDSSDNSIISSAKEVGKAIGIIRGSIALTPSQTVEIPRYRGIAIFSSPINPGALVLILPEKSYSNIAKVVELANKTDGGIMFNKEGDFLELNFSGENMAVTNKYRSNLTLYYSYYQ